MERARVLLVRPTGSTPIQLMRYGAVAVVALSVDVGGLVLLKEVFGLNYLLAATLSFSGGIAVNYALSKLWVFNVSQYASRAREFTIFLAIGLIGLALNDLILWTLTTSVGLHYLVSKGFATGIVFAWNFTARKRLLF